MPASKNHQNVVGSTIVMIIRIPVTRATQAKGLCRLRKATPSYRIILKPLYSRKQRIVQKSPPLNGGEPFYLPLFLISHLCISWSCS